MTKRIDFEQTVDGTAQDAKDSIDTLETQRSNGNVSDFSVEYRADVDAVNIHVWRDVSTVDDLPTAYDDVDAALSNLPVALSSATDDAPVVNP